MGASTRDCCSSSLSLRVRCNATAADDTLLRLLQRLLDQAFERGDLLILSRLELFYLILQLRHVALDGKKVVALLGHASGELSAGPSTTAWKVKLPSVCFTLGLSPYFNPATFAGQRGYSRAVAAFAFASR